MNALSIVVLVLAILVVVLSVIVVVLKVVVGRVRKSSAAKIESQFSPTDIVRADPLANFFGLESKGGAQVRGNGALVLTRTMVWFSRAGGSVPLEIPLAAVREVDAVKTHAGKSVGRRLLWIRFETDRGFDSVAWFVRDVDDWITAIRATRS
ncbi:hypothetical protein JGU71_19945 [Antrihabitans sp. YC3-6]|uniref:Uncharacterized protein n=1 Tax=Antrihabitans stalagmiti TaxID=2799499 RepID=A0A934U5R6_9NOCA|nr:hypothetical protein [Antrihabitans stalagmiti]MBJ8341163.1 hypothetical protein [Antrihabitans stalagmiti]